ncbi:helix-turn-helix domain-containing protein [Bacteroides fragilis]|nr:helix-turn-helix domain-containing protein [Bacteroides fragilis]MCE8652207.1 helix-turn-helix domain-containing protein [Bacteroides fragilis]
MEVVTIEKNTFDDLQQEVDNVILMSEDLLRKLKPEHAQWLDHENVCLMLNISKRTLQNYKDQGILPHSRINRKSYFKLSDVELLLKNLTKNKDGIND